MRGQTRENHNHFGWHCTETGSVRPHPICWSIPLAIGPQAVLCAPSRAACSVGPTAAAQLVRPRYSMHTRHCTFARAVVMKKNSAATASTAARV